MKLLIHCENPILADEYKANLEAKGISCHIQNPILLFLIWFKSYKEDIYHCNQCRKDFKRM